MACHTCLARFEDFPERIIPYDYNAYFANPARFVMVTTNCLTGKAEYMEEKSSSERVMDIVRASSSLPFVSPVTYVDSVPMLDGGIADSIPIEYAMNQGYEKQNPVVVGRMEKDTAKLTALYEEGYEVTRKFLGEENTHQ
jgi:predicted patatin/cPLA2 family phospholipase